MKNEVKKISFEGGELLGVKDENGKVWLGVKNACLDIGLSEGQYQNETRKIQSDLVLSKGIANMQLLTKGGNQEVLCLSEKFVPMWLAKIHLTPTMKNQNPDAVQKLVTYQLKAVDALHEAFMATEEQKERLFDELGLKGEIVNLKKIVENQEVKLDNQTLKIDKLESTVGLMIDSATINSRQAHKIWKVGKDRVGVLLGGAKSDLYKKEYRKYFINMWNQFKEIFEIATYKDLNPMNVKDGYEFINNWALK